MFTRSHHMQTILKGLSVLQYYIKFTSGKLANHDINKACEPFFCDIFNILCNSDYTCIKDKFYPAIDLYDKTKAQSMQITTTNTKEKIWHTIKTFEKHELYNDYNCLIHFIIGEKNLSERSSDLFKFKLKKTEEINGLKILECTRKVKKGKFYKIKVMDLMDLILIIDSQEIVIIRKIYDYLTENLDTTINIYKKELYNIYPNVIPSFNANSFMNSLKEYKEPERTKLYNSLIKLASNINNLNTNLRRLLFIIIDTSKRNSSTSEKIVINPDVIINLLEIKDEKKFERELTSLIHEELLDEDMLRSECLINIRFYDFCGNELMNDIYDYCIKNDCSLEKLILDVDFSELD